MANKNNEELVSMLAEAIRSVQKPQVTNEDATNASLVAVQINQKVNIKAQKQMEFANRIAYEMDHNINCSMIAVPKIYYEYQPSFVITLNGCTIKVPADGVQRKIHNEFAVILKKRMRALDDKLEAMRNNRGFDNRELTR